MSQESLFDPSRDSRGIWFLLHRMAILSTTDTKKAQFINYVTFLTSDFPCEKCRNHLKEFIVNNPFHLYMYVSNGDNSDVGIFKWTWALHNSVNTKLSKPKLDFPTAYNLYKGDVIKVCTTGCEEDEKKTQETIAVVSENSKLSEPFKGIRLVSANGKRK